MSNYALPKEPEPDFRDRILSGFRPFGSDVPLKSDEKGTPEDLRRKHMNPTGVVIRATLPGEVFARPDLGPADRLPPLAFPTLMKKASSEQQTPQAIEGDDWYHWKNPVERMNWMKGQWAEAFRVPQLCLEELGPWRVRAAWRLVREMARARGVIEADQMLIELEDAYSPQAAPTFDGAPAATSLMYDPWITPEQHIVPGKQGKQAVKQGTEAYTAMRTHQLILGAEATLENKDEYRPFQWVLSQATEETPQQQWNPVHYKGLPLLPPPIPLPWIDPTNPDKPREGYDPKNPEHDPALHAYLAILKGIVSMFYIDLGTETDQNAGRYGLAGLMDPELIRLAFPSRFQMMAFEGLLVEETLDLVIKAGKSKAREELQKHYGLQPIECLQLVRIATIKAIELTSGDVEEDRSVMILRLEAAAARARDSLDIRAEIAALKNIAVVQGLARVEPQDMVSDFISVVREASGRKMVENVAPRRLPG